MGNQVTNGLFSALPLTCMIIKRPSLPLLLPQISPYLRYRLCQGRDYLSAELFYMMPTRVVNLKLVMLSYYKLLHKTETVSEEKIRSKSSR